MKTFTQGTSGGDILDFILSKATGGTESWHVYHSALGHSHVGYIDTTAAWRTDDNHKVSASSSTQFTYDNYGLADVMFYCWRDIPGFSKFGSYRGNADADGPYVYLGFRPKMIIFKNTETTNGWRIMDTEVNKTNSFNTGMYPNGNSVEDSPVNWTVDYLSNGFKIRDSNNELNASADVVIYAAWAENPFKTTRAR